MSRLPSIALITGTRNRPAELRRFLVSVGKQKYPASRVIIIDQSDPPALADNAQIVTQLDGNPRLEHLIAPTSGLSAARNVGLQIADEDIVGFPDDDCWYSADVLARVVSGLSEPETGFICGRYREPDREVVEHPASPQRFTPLSVLRHCNSVSLFFKNGELRRCGLLFDERVGAGTDLPAGEETDFVLRALQYGIRGRWDPSLVIYHAELRAANLRDEEIAGRTRAFAYTISQSIMRGQLELGLPATRFLLRWSCVAPFRQRARLRVGAFVDGVRRAVHEHMQETVEVVSG